MSRWALAGAFALATTIVVVGVATAKEYNFELHASKKGCASIVFPSRRSTCESQQKEKDDRCRKRLACEYGKAEKLVDELKKRRESLKKANDSDKKAIEQKIAELENKIKTMKAVGARGVPFAEECVRARSKMKSMFKGTIPLTKDAGYNAKQKRQKLLDQLKEAQKKAEEAKREKDKAERGDDGPKRKWEEAQKEVRRLEKELERFNGANGKDIQRNVDYLIRHYEEGRKEHEQPERDDQNRLENCKKLSNIRY